MLRLRHCTLVLSAQYQLQSSLRRSLASTPPYRSLFTRSSPCLALSRGVRKERVDTTYFDAGFWRHRNEINFPKQSLWRDRESIVTKVVNWESDNGMVSFPALFMFLLTLVMPVIMMVVFREGGMVSEWSIGNFSKREPVALGLAQLLKDDVADSPALAAARTTGAAPSYLDTLQYLRNQTALEESDSGSANDGAQGFAYVLKRAEMKDPSLQPGRVIRVVD